ncbi:MAG: hypothetical protein QF464_19700, partial [Myxococcota bacterium]|nr:hypothetical protein [Myxococcota bacterium]
MMASRLVALAMGLLMVSTAHAEQPWPPDGGTLIDEIVALVGKEPITRRELEQATIALIRGLRAQGQVVDS